MTSLSIEEQLVTAIPSVLSNGARDRTQARSILDVIDFHVTLALAYRAQFTLWDATGGRVLSGPFAGMLFPRPREIADLRLLAPIAGGSFTIGPFLLGTYEGELHAAIEDLLSATDYEEIVDIGCSIGYYAVGIAMRQPGVHVHARDTNAEALDHVRALAALNGVSPRVTVGGEWRPIDFERIGGRRTLIVCDIEGAELQLLDPKQVPQLAGCDMLVEMHDVFDPQISSTLAARFRDTHRVVIHRNNGHRAPVPEGAAVLDRHERSAVLADLRLGPTPWAVMKAMRPWGR